MASIGAAFRGAQEALADPRPLAHLRFCGELHGLVKQYLEAHEGHGLRRLRVEGVADSHQLRPRREGGFRAERADEAPGALLKADWFAKHSDQIPAVCMVLVQADFTCAYPEWEQQAASIERDVALTRECLGGHPTRLVLACIQIEGSTPTTSPRRSDAQRSERLGAICRQLEMSSRALLLVPSPHLRQGEPTGPMINMADTVAVAASEFYAEEAKRRAQLCSLVPHSQKAASARCEAKVAFFLDMAADASAAAAYERAIDTLTDLWAEPEQCSPGTLVGRLEAAGLAGLLTTRVCALYLATGSTAGATAAHARLMRAFQPAARPQSAVEWAAASLRWSWCAHEHARFGAQLQKVADESAVGASAWEVSRAYHLAARCTLRRAEAARRAFAPAQSAAASDDVAQWAQTLTSFPRGRHALCLTPAAVALARAGEDDTGQAQSAALHAALAAPGSLGLAPSDDAPSPAAAQGREVVALLQQWGSQDDAARAAAWASGYCLGAARSLTAPASAVPAPPPETAAVDSAAVAAAAGPAPEGAGEEEGVGVSAVAGKGDAEPSPLSVDPALGAVAAGAAEGAGHMSSPSAAGARKSPHAGAEREEVDEEGESAFPQAPTQAPAPHGGWPPAPGPSQAEMQAAAWRDALALLLAAGADDRRPHLARALLLISRAVAALEACSPPRPRATHMLRYEQASLLFLCGRPAEAHAALRGVHDALAAVAENHWCTAHEPTTQATAWVAHPWKRAPQQGQGSAWASPAPPQRRLSNVLSRARASPQVSQAGRAEERSVGAAAFGWSRLHTLVLASFRLVSFAAGDAAGFVSTSLQLLSDACGLGEAESGQVHRHLMTCLMHRDGLARVAREVANAGTPLPLPPPASAPHTLQCRLRHALSPLRFSALLVPQVAGDAAGGRPFAPLSPADSTHAWVRLLIRNHLPSALHLTSLTTSFSLPDLALALEDATPPAVKRRHSQPGADLEADFPTSPGGGGDSDGSDGNGQDGDRLLAASPPHATAPGDAAHLLVSPTSPWVCDRLVELPMAPPPPAGVAAGATSAREWCLSCSAEELVDATTTVAATATAATAVPEAEAASRFSRTKWAPPSYSLECTHAAMRIAFGGEEEGGSDSEATKEEGRPGVELEVVPSADGADWLPRPQQSRGGHTHAAPAPPRQRWSPLMAVSPPTSRATASIHAPGPALVGEVWPFRVRVARHALQPLHRAAVRVRVRLAATSGRISGGGDARLLRWGADGGWQDMSAASRGERWFSVCEDAPALAGGGGSGSGSGSGEHAVDSVWAVECGRAGTLHVEVWVAAAAARWHLVSSSAAREVEVLPPFRVSWWTHPQPAKRSERTDGTGALVVKAGHSVAYGATLSPSAELPAGAALRVGSVEARGAGLTVAGGEGCLRGHTLREGESACAALLAGPAGADARSQGVLRVRWSRSAAPLATGGERLPTEEATAVLALPRVRALRPEVSFQVSVGGKEHAVRVGQPVTLGLHARLLADLPKAVAVSVAPAPHFVLAGMRQFRAQLRPGTTASWECVLVPTSPGYCALPCVSVADAETGAEYAEAACLRHVFVQPA